MLTHSYWKWNIQEDHFVLGSSFWESLSERYPEHFFNADKAKSLFTNTDMDRVKELLHKALHRSDTPVFSASSNHQLTDPVRSFSLHWTGEVFGSSSASEYYAIGEVRSLSRGKESSLQMPNNPEFYQQLMDSLPDSVFFKDLESRFIAINKACADKFGIDDPSEAIGKTDFDFFNLSHAQQAFEDEQAIIKTGKPIIHKTEKEVYLNEDMRTTWTSTSKLPLYNSDGIIIGTYGVSTDITDQKRAQKQNERLRNQLVAVFDTDPNMLFVKDKKGKYVIVNKAKADFHNLPKTEIIGKTDFDLPDVSEETAESFSKTDRYVIDQRESVFIPEDSEVDESGNTTWFQAIKVPFQLVKNGQLAALTIVMDITEQKERELELNKTLDIISQQNQRLTNFTHIVSHNLRNHAGSISMILELISLDDSEEERSDNLKQLKIASDRLNETIQDLNEIIDQQYKDQKVERDVNLKQFTDKVLQVLTTEIRANQATFNVDIPEDLNLEYNPAYLESILHNLFSNAIKYRHPDRTPQVKVKAHRKDEHIHLIVKDNGLGIDLDKHGKQLFGMYKTFHGNDNAKGIGLYITKNQIESMGGEINAESTPGGGTTFNICLN